ncbi:MAG: hypothetical protein QF775_01560 [archaeon]|jgi:hypothetical protein|nr:hypothetical protein [Euryarchaeota archaeon]MDP6704153.1 hypothetical protein [archaeon]|tara:strand:- start:41293 stop:41670 length:378 start_codon:yes stop_codon:yes gene_type:complete
MARKAQGLSITTIVTLALAVMVLFFVVQFFTGGFRDPAAAASEAGTETAEGIEELDIRERILGQGYDCDRKSGISAADCEGLTQAVCNSINTCQWDDSYCGGTVTCSDLTLSQCQKVSGCTVVAN